MTIIHYIPGLMCFKKLISQFDRKQSLLRDKLYKCNEGTANTYLQFIKSQLKIISGPQFILLVIFYNIFITSVMLKIHELRYSSTEYCKWKTDECLWLKLKQTDFYRHWKNNEQNHPQYPVWKGQT